MYPLSMVRRAGGQDLSPVDEGERRALGVGVRGRRPFVVELLSFLAVAIGYLLLLPAIAWYPAYLSLGDSYWWMFVINSVAPFLFLPVPLVFVLALINRRWALLVAALVPTVVFVMLFGQLFVPPSIKAPTVDAAAPSLTLLSYNLHAWNEDADGIAEALLASGADVIALQELAPEMAEALRVRLGDQFPYQDLVLRDGWGGLGVFSRVPVSPVSQRVGSTGVRNPQVTTLHLDWGDTTLINVHNLSIPRTLPDWPTEITNSIRQRERVSNAIIEFSRQEDAGPVIAAGDFNTTSRSTAYETVASGLTDSWTEAGFGFGTTFPGGPFSPTPLDFSVPDWLLRIDYVFHSSEIVATEARIGPWDGVSDHRPVRVDLAWPDANL